MSKRKIRALAAAAAAAMTVSVMPAQAADTDVSIVINGKAAVRVACTYDGVTYTNDDAMNYLRWFNDTNINEKNLYIKSYNETNAEHPTDYTLFGGDKIVISYEVNVEQAGVYQLDMSAGDVTNRYLSYYSVAMDDGDYKAISSTSSTVSEPADVSGSALVKNYQTPYKYNLTAGKHTFKVRIKDLPAVGAKAKNQFDTVINTITFNKTDDKNVNDIYINGSDNYSSKTDGLNVQVPEETSDNGVQTGSGILLRTASGVFADGGYIVSYPFTVTEPGTYSVADVAGTKSTATWLSPFAVSVDDAEYIKLKDVKKSETTYGTHMSHMSVDKRYALDAGEHILKIYIYEARDAGNAYTFFDYVKLSRDIESGIAVYGTDGFKSNIASLSDGYNATQLVYPDGKTGTNPCTDGKNLSIRGTAGTADAPAAAVPAEGIRLDYPVYVDKTDWYSLDLVIGNLNTWFSPISIAVDNGDEYAFASNNLTNVISNETYDSNRQLVDTKLSYYLKEGVHTFSYKVTGLSSSRGYALAFFTEARFTPFSDAEKVNDIKIYGTDPTSFIEPGLTLTTSSELTNTAVRKFRSSHANYPEKGYMEVTYPFNVYNGGKYDLTVAASDINSIYVSKWDIAVDGELLDFKNNIASNEKHSDATSDLMRVYTLGKSCDLEAGTHYVTIRINSEKWNNSTASASDGAFVILDYIGFKLQDTPVYSLSLSDKYIEKGERTLASVSAVSSATGESITPDYASVVYSSSDVSVAAIDSATGEITAISGGSAVISADITLKDSSVISVSDKLCITLNYIWGETEGIYINGEKVESVSAGTATVTAKVNLYNNDLFEGKATVIIAAYENGTLKQVNAQTREDLPGYEITPVEVSLENLEASENTKIRVMIWNDFALPTPIVKRYDL